MTRLLAVSAVFPPHRYHQREITETLVHALPPGYDAGLLRRVHGSVRVEHRHLALPLERYGRQGSFGETNQHYLQTAAELGSQALTQALAEAQLDPGETDFVLSTTITGVATPSLEARLAAETGLRRDVKRLPLFGLGCAGGVAGLAHLHDYLSGHPQQVGMLLSVELCSLTLQLGDLSTGNLVAGALFGDGGGALLAVGRDHPRYADPGCQVIATRSRLYPGTGHLLGWDVGEWGFRMVLDSEVPELVRLHVAEEVESFLADHDLKPSDVTAWICHPGGPRILDVLTQALGLPDAAFAPSRRSLAAAGNLSSASVLHILRDVQSTTPPAPGSVGLMIGFGPGFASELVLLCW
ncbi:type III polyketide synthase [Streptomyces sp. NPDC006879]|uniref:type III polyketide synthase n=1 Tax=Streptomyces sp. NPDC006879 TaxID=3364767 RepID=UPI0036C43AC4